MRCRLRFRFYWHTKELKSKLYDAFNASYNMVADAMQLWKDQPNSTADLQECQRALAEVNEMYQRCACAGSAATSTLRSWRA